MSQYSLTFNLIIKVYLFDIYFMILFILPCNSEGYMKVWDKWMNMTSVWSQTKSRPQWPIFHWFCVFLYIKKWHWPGVSVSHWALALVIRCFEHHWMFRERGSITLLIRTFSDSGIKLQIWIKEKFFWLLGEVSDHVWTLSIYFIQLNFFSLEQREVWSYKEVISP